MDNVKFEELRSISRDNIVNISYPEIDELKKINVGSLLSINGESFKVLDVAKITESNKKFTKEKSYYAYEYNIFSLKDKSTKNFEWSYDDEIEIAFTESNIVVDFQLDENEVSVDGFKFFKEEVWRGFFKKDGDVENLIYHEYVSRNGSMMTVETWDDETCRKGYISSVVDRGNLEITAYG